MAKKTATMKLGKADYAKVPDRVKEFRTAHPDGKIEQDNINLPDGQIEFRAWIWKDKTQLIELIKSGVTNTAVLRSSSDSNGTAKKATKDVKDFEKLETIAVGRALAMLGYLASGEIASSEEMEEFLADKEQKAQEEINEITEKIGECKSDYALAKYWLSLPGIFKTNPAVFLAKEEKKKSFKKPKEEEVSPEEGIIEEETQ